MKKILIAFLALVTALSCFAFIGCENKKEEIQANADKQATLDMYIFDKDGQTISEDFVLPGKIGKYDATWTSNNAIIALEELAGDEENGIERQYVAKVGLPEERTEINLTVALSEEVTKSFTVYVNSLSVYDFSGAYNFIQNNGTVFTSFALDTTCEFKGHTATITWSVDEEYADYLEISEDGKECIVYPSSLNPQVRINATFAYKGETTTKGYRMTVSEQKEPLQEVDYWYTNTGVGIVMSGYVVSIATVYSETYGNVSLYMVNDEFTAGYYLYRVKADSQNAALLAPGVHVTVTGTTNTNYNGLIETNAGGTLVVDADVPAINVNEKVYAIDNDIIGDLQSAHYNQSRLVSLTNWTVKKIEAAVEEGKTGTLFVVTKGGVDVSIAVSKYMEGAYLCNASDATWSALAALQTTVKVGDILSVTGILGNYKGHQIMPLSAEAVVVGGTADAEGTVYAGQKAAKAVAAIDKLIADNGLASIVAVAKNVKLPAEVEGCEVAFRVIGEPRSISIVDGALVINPGKMERACLTAVITVDGFTTNIFRYIEAADLDDAAKVELEEKELTFVTDEAINANTVLTVPVVGNLFNNVTISWASNNECAVVDGSTITITVPEEIVEVIFTATITLNNAVLTKEFVVEVGKPANISLVDFVALATGLEHNTVTTKKYLVTGIVTEIANAKYGNLYVTDAAGNKLYVYGCYDVDGTNRYDAMSNAPQVGDYVVLFGVASNYNGPQMKNAWVQSCTSPISIEEATAIALALENQGPTSTEKYLVTGTVTEIANTKYGNLYITDDAGNKLYVYGTYSEDGANRYDAMGEAAPQLGDVITVYGVASNYNGAQLKNVWVVARTVGNHEHDFTGEWKSNATKHWKECACGEIADEADHSLENNVCSVCGYEVVVVTYVQPVAGNKYYLSMLQGKAGKTVYLAGGMAQTYYLATTEDKTAAVKVFVENAEGGLYLGYYDASGAKNYLNVVVSDDGAHVNSVIASAAETVYTYSAELGTLVADVNGTSYIIGTRNDKTYTTIGPVKVETDPFYVLFELAEAACEHTGGTATCKELAICANCGEAYGELADHAWGEALSHDAVNHWVECSVCGEKKDEAAHDFANGDCACGELKPVCNHVWSDATCTEGSTCTICGEKGQAALGHDWADATCTDPKTCLVCKVTEGEALGHDMADATCTAPKTCKNGCGLTEGEALGHKDESADYKCDVCSTVMAPEADSYLTVEQAIALAKCYAHNTYTTNKYFVTGIVTNVYNTTYGNMYLKDENGKELCIYGLYTWDKETRYDKMSYKPIEGDELTVYGILGTYNSTAQMKDAWMDDVVAHEHNYDDGVVTEATCTKDGYTTYTCSICSGTYTDNVVTAPGHNYVEGTCSVCGAADPSVGGEDKPAVNYADFSKFTKKTQYMTHTTSDQLWTATNSQIVIGGTSDSSQNGTFIVLGDSTAVVLNGKTSAIGSLTSATLTGGISKLSFSYTNVFSESNGVDVTINIKVDGTVVATTKLDNNSVTQYTEYTYEWVLDSAITGDFVIEIVNNCPSNSSKNKDRVAIWNLSWTSEN